MKKLFKKILQKILCALGVHGKMKTLGVSTYRYSRGAFSFCEKKQLVKQCPHCGHANTPEWYNEDYRLLRPHVDFTGWPSEWRPEFPELLKMSADHKKETA